jgi:hypothetical protein
MMSPSMVPLVYKGNKGGWQLAVLGVDGGKPMGKKGGLGASPHGGEQEGSSLPCTCGCVMIPHEGHIWRTRAQRHHASSFQSAHLLKSLPAPLLFLGGKHQTLGGKHQTLGGKHRTLGGKHQTLGGKHQTLGGKHQTLTLSAHESGRAFYSGP